MYGLAADLHLHSWSAFSSTNADGMNNRLSMLLDEIERLCKATHEAGGSDVIFAGDVFHVRGSVAPSVLNPLRDCLAVMHDRYRVHFTILAGNHDLESKDSKRMTSAVTALECAWVTVVNEPTKIKDIDAYLVPWFDDIASLKQVLENLCVPASLRGEFDLIIHAPIDGVIEGLPAHGLDPDYLAGLGFKRVFAGHYHNHRQMHPGVAVPKGTGKSPEDFDYYGEVWSIGALAHHSWSDVGSRAGFLLVHDDEVHWKPSQLPAFVDLGSLVDVPTEDLPGMVKGNYIRVRIEADKVAEVEGVRKELLDMGARAVLTQPQPKAPVRAGVERATTTAGASLEVSIKAFAAKLEDPERVTKAAFDVLAAADALEV